MKIIQLNNFKLLSLTKDNNGHKNKIKIHCKTNTFITPLRI